MSQLSSFCKILLTFVVAINIKLAICADKATQNNTKVLLVSELYSELSVASDNICNSHEKNVAYDVIVIDGSVGHENRRQKRQAPHVDNRREYIDRPRNDQKSLLIIFDGTG